MKENPQKNYVSCIKINGVPILPPLITPEKRKELKRYKREAIKIENRLKRERELKKRIVELYSSCSEAKETISVENEQETQMTDSELKTYVENLFNTNSESHLQSNIMTIATVDALMETQVPEQTAATANATENVNQNEDNTSNNDKCNYTLTRSNSYVLDSPSPALLEYYRKMNAENDDLSQNMISVEKEIATEVENCNLVPCTELEQLTLVDVNANERITNECNAVAEIELNTDTESHFDSSRTEAELKCLSDCDSNNTVHVNLHDLISNNAPNLVEQLQEKKASAKATLDLTLEEVIDKLPTEFSKHILEILESQQKGNNYETFNVNIQLEPDKFSTPQENTLVNTTDSFYFSAEDATVANVEKINGKMSKERAAEILCAAAKSYLVRRLMKTEKVQILIQTIKEALLCAVQLHAETLENIDESDVELHRRLIQQVSAACYAFHDVFFNTSIQDQMSYISVDRQKKLDKMKRLSSANSTSSSVSRKSSSRSTKDFKAKRNRRASSRF